ncbi:Probable RNA-directed DNA polymerase from transposon BS [Eumeta japonica]|uniref:Probable RNA-directed DNA polymerase from transposon BS n=1 Tax=Eumeta variegata TaxID=151549 RepID=A0A4C1ZDY9_EUMVA|nr:Probable RNA-directed DNA polymerase from transposon BS [Eumeta japonica]
MENEYQELVYDLDEKGNRVLVRSLECSKRAHLRFTNKTKRHVDVWWRDYTGLKRFYVRLRPGEHYNIDTFLTHPWEFTDAITKESYVVANKFIYRPPVHLGGKNYRTNWNITISVRTLRLTALLALGGYIRDPNVVDSLGLPVRCSYQPRQDSGRGERAGGSGILGSPEVSARYSRIDKSKNTALRRASAYPTPEYRSRARALQREVKARVREFRNESWSDLMEEIKPSHKAFWAVTKALKTEGYTPIPLLKKPDNSVAIDDAEIAECLADSIETQCSHASPPHDIAHISRIEEEVLQNFLEPKDDLAPVSLSEVQTLVKSLNTRKAPGLDGIHKPGKPRDLPASYRPISILSGLGKLFEKILKTRLSDYLLGKGLIIDEQFGFRPAHSCPQQVLRLVEYVSEGFETERSTVAVFFDVAKAFDRQTDISHLGMSALTRQDVLSEQEFLKAPPSLLCCTPRTQTIYRDRRRLASNSRYSRTIPRSLTEVGIGTPDSPSSPSRGPLTS